MTTSNYDPRTDPDLDDDQKEEASNRLECWVAMPRDRDYLDEIESRLPDAVDRWAWFRAWAFANDKATNGLLPKADALRLLGDPERVTRLAEAELLLEHSEGWRLTDYLRVNRSRLRIGRTAAARAAVGVIGGKNSGETRRRLKEGRESKQLLRSPDTDGLGSPLTDQSTGTGTGTGTGRNANDHAEASPPSGAPAASKVSNAAKSDSWVNIDPSELKDFAGLERLHARLVPKRLIEDGDLGLYELAAMVIHALRKGTDPAAYLANALQRWRDDPCGYKFGEVDRDNALKWLARADAKRAKYIAEGLWQIDRKTCNGFEEAEEGVDAEYQRRIRIIDDEVKRWKEGKS